MSNILLGIAIVLFIFAAFGAAFLGLNFVAAGLAFFAASFLTIQRGTPPNA